MNEIRTIFAKTTGRGNAVEVSYDGEKVRVTLDGTPEFESPARCHGLYSVIGTSLGDVVTRKAGVPDGSYRLGRIVITPDEMATIRSAIPCTCSEYDRMERERAAYIATLGAVSETCESDYPGGIDSPAYWADRKAELDAVEARNQAIRDWDNAHPEHTAARKQHPGRGYSPRRKLVAKSAGNWEARCLQTCRDNHGGNPPGNKTQERVKMGHWMQSSALPHCPQPQTKWVV